MMSFVMGALILLPNHSQGLTSISPDLLASFDLGYSHGSEDGDYDGYQTGLNSSYEPAYHWALDDTLDTSDFPEELIYYINGYKKGYAEGFEEGKARANGGTESTDYKKGYEDGYADANAGKSFNPFEDNDDPSADYLDGYHTGYFAGVGGGTETTSFTKGYKVGYRCGVFDASKGVTVTDVVAVLSGTNSTTNTIVAENDYGITGTGTNTGTSTLSELTSEYSSYDADFIKGLKAGYADGVAHVKETMTVSQKTTGADGQIFTKFSDQSLKVKTFGNTIVYYPYKAPDMWVEMSADGKTQVIWTKESVDANNVQKWVSTDGRTHYVYPDGSWYQSGNGAWTQFDATTRIMWSSTGDIIQYYADGKRCIMYLNGSQYPKFYILGQEVSQKEFEGSGADLGLGNYYNMGYQVGLAGKLPDGSIQSASITYMNGWMDGYWKYINDNIGEDLTGQQVYFAAYQLGFTECSYGRAKRTLSTSSGDDGATNDQSFSYGYNMGWNAAYQTVIIPQTQGVGAL